MEAKGGHFEMMKHEFETLIEAEVNDEEYEIIETVYMNYPGITEKEQVIEMYKKHGIVIFTDLYSRAKDISEKERQINALQREIRELQSGRA